MSKEIKKQAAEHIKRFREIGQNRFNPVMQLSSSQMRLLHSYGDWNETEKAFFDMTADNFYNDQEDIHTELSYSSEDEIVIVGARSCKIKLILIAA